MKLTQKNFDGLIVIMNHRLTKLETHMKWIKYLTGAIFVAVIIGGI